MKITDKRSTMICTVILAILAVVFFIITTITGITELFADTADPNRVKSGEVIEYRVIYAKEVVEIKHMLFGVIPTYSERFYATTNESGANNLVIRADEKWFEENFTPEGIALAPIKVSGLIKSADSKNGLDLTSVNERLGGEMRVNTWLYADAAYVIEATLKIIAGILLLTAFITIILMIILYNNEVLVKGGAGGNIMTVAAIIQLAAFIIIMFAV